MINWTIGQLGLGEAQVLGMGPQGTGKDKGASARVEAHPFLVSVPPPPTPPFFSSTSFSADFERKAVIFLNCIRWLRLPTSVSHTF